VDAARDRLYLPVEDLARFGVPEEALLDAARTPAIPRSAAIDSLLAFEADRAREHFERARRALPDVDRRAMLSAEIMGAVYRSLLEAISRRGHPLTLPVVRLSRPRKAAIALRTVPRVYWGL
jgi:phytoene synthase